MHVFRSMAVVILVALTSGLSAAEPPANLPPKIFVNDAPKNPKTVAAAKDTKVGEQVTVRGSIPAGSDVFAANAATFVIAGDKETDRATIRVVDKAGKPLAADIKGRRGLNPGAEVVVSGKRAAGEGFAVDAASIFVAKAALPEGLIAPEPAADALWVEEARKAAKVGQTVTIRGYIGGSLEPFVAGRAVFTIIGKGLVSCADRGEDHCKTPWDYCCESKQDIATHAATIQVVDPAGQVLRTGVKTGAVKETAEVIVVGKVTTADAKTLVVSATTIHAVKK